MITLLDPPPGAVFVPAVLAACACADRTARRRFSEAIVGAKNPSGGIGSAELRAPASRSGSRPKPEEDEPETAERRPCSTLLVDPPFFRRRPTAESDALFHALPILLLVVIDPSGSMPVGEGPGERKREVQPPPPGLFSERLLLLGPCSLSDA